MHGYSRYELLHPASIISEKEKLEMRKTAISVCTAMVVLILLIQNFAFANCDDAMLSCADPTVMKAIQLNLRDRGLYKGKITGKYNTATRKAVIQFSKQNNIKYDEYLNKRLVKALWGQEIDYANASPEERIAFLKKIGVLNERRSDLNKPENTSPEQ